MESLREMGFSIPLLTPLIKNNVHTFFQVLIACESFMLLGRLLNSLGAQYLKHLITISVFVHGK